jgi:hypothetical protein
MWRKLRKILMILVASAVALLAIIALVFFVQDRREKRAYARQQADQLIADAYAVRLRADGDRLAKAGEWEDALARYNQARDYDRGNEDKQKLQVIKEHVGEVVWDKEFEADGSPP